MFVLVYLGITISVYIALNKKLQDSTKVGWFVGYGLIFILNVVSASL